ncbi:putative prokaryotic DNA topoisomerase [Schistosoma mansoni]|uniref:putative prokaryotic DNA topoisomerase n=1 Tax=Schistosoma mansoni TaxID=6183 RepID=UPI00022DC851|nr:putative prokaryotic DNA topoisomerase [Schistosoma mansoni]|eukprot:XP_018653105.1 putative prokaryotic DNA topoisomerase [Schistosoma mansoni]
MISKCLRLLLIISDFPTASGVRRFTMKILNVAEKNDAAKNISEILSRGGYHRREGISKFNKIYEFPMNLNGQNVMMVMTSVSGHLTNYDFLPNYKSWHSCNPMVLFDAPIVKQVLKDYEPIKQTLQREVRSCQKLIIWTDCDREGENIGVEVIDVCREIKPNIEILRARFSEITPAAVHRAVDRLTIPDYNASTAVDVRQELDLRIGAAFTRFQTLRLRRVFPQALSDQLISYGSCQFPTLGFVVERFREVDQFVSEPFWRIVVTVSRDEKTTEFQWQRGRLFDQDCCRAYYEHLNQNRYGQIVEVIKRPKTKWRPTALDTVELEKLASRKLQMGAKYAMQLAERLYNKGFISYPRTETKIFPPDLDLKSLVHVQINDSRWSDFATRILERGPNPKNGKSSDKAHPPIHPLKVGDSLQGDEARLYELVTRHFLACLSTDAEGAETIVRLCIDGELFESKGLMILALNYLEVYIYDRWAEKDMPVFQLGEWILPDNIQVLTGQTCPPPLLTEADLISLMDRHGIGTDATHAEHIETIKQRLYVGLEQNKFLVPGQLGMGLVEGYDSMGFEMSKPNLRSEFEADLKLICEGRKTKEEVLHHHLNKYKELFRLALNQASFLDRALALRLEQEAENVQNISGSVGEMASFAASNNTIDGHNQSNVLNPVVAFCPTCHSGLVLRQKRSALRPLTTSSNLSNNSGSNEVNQTSNGGWFLSCSGYPNCRYAIWFPDSVIHVRVLSETNENTCNRCADFIPSSSVRPSNDQLRPLKLGLRFRRNFYLPNGYIQDDDTKESVDNAEAGDSDNILCNCGHSAIQLTVKKPGPNQGRLFYRCPGLAGNSCDFFLWKSQTTPITIAQSSPLYSSTQVSLRNVIDPCSRLENVSEIANCVSDRTSGLGSSDSNSACVICRCGEPAKLLVVNKQSSNKGRHFYACPNSRPNVDGGPASGCNFFQWADHIDPASGQSDSSSYGLSNRRYASGSSIEQGLSYHRTAANAETNISVGHVPSWPPPASNNSRGAISRNKNRDFKDRSLSASSSVTRCCGLCRQPGHTRNRCPHSTT